MATTKKAKAEKASVNIRIYKSTYAILKQHTAKHRGTVIGLIHSLALGLEEVKRRS